MTSSLEAQSGYHVYTPMTLAGYDLVVHGISNRWLWNCPTVKLRMWFDQHVTNNHLDVGVGTGYFLANSRILDSSSRIGFLDANKHCLRAASQRIVRFQPEMIEANLADPFSERIAPFQSLSLMYVLHCLPGDVAFRRQVLKHCAASLLPGGCLFGATILGQPHPTGWLGRRVMAVYNRKGIFGNAGDTKASLEEVLADSLEEIHVEQVGSVALFAGVRA